MASVDFDSFAIFPALNVARVGNADNDVGDEYYYVGSEIPGVKPQAARFRIYGYKNDKIVGEIKSSEDVTIKWTVVLANKKAAHRGFFGIKNHNNKEPIRNADWPYDRSTLMAIKENSLASNDTGQSVEFKGRVYRYNDNDIVPSDGHELYLGKMIVEKEGSLLIIGGKGKSGCVKEDAFITNYANNDYWYDDTSDGSIDATVTINGEEIRNREGKSWVLVAPPKFAPGIHNVVSLYQVILETQHPVDPDEPINDPVVAENNRGVNYYRDIRPIFETISKNSWVNRKGFMGHGLNKPGEDVYKSFEEIIPDTSQQVKSLNKAALEWCVGGPFYPGIEMTYVAYDKNTFHKEYDFRINYNAIQPGDINAYMALPWQADFNECNTHWWPAQRPDIAIPKKRMDEITNGIIKLDDFEEWTRGFRNNSNNGIYPQWGNMDMVRVWNRLGFVVENTIHNNTETSFVEVDRQELFELNKDNISVKEFTLNNLYCLLKIALQIELSTIPPYLYALYSIKPGSNIGDTVRYKIRHVAAEEMLHASLVANLMVAIGHQPIFYSPTTIPHYPTPLPHIDQDLPIDFESIGDLYQTIKKFFKKLHDMGKIKYQKNFQLEPGMGYAPSTGTGNDGLIVIKDLDSALRAIDLIIVQGEGKYNMSEMKIDGYFDGELKEISGKISGDIVEKNIENNKCMIEGKFDGTIEKGKFENVGENSKISEGIIKGVIKTSNGTKTIERVIQGNFKGFDNNTFFNGSKEKFLSVKIESSLNGKFYGSIEEDSHYNAFKICKIDIENVSESEYQLWPVISDPSVSSYTDPKIIATATAFNAAYSYLMLLLQNVWKTDGQNKKMLVLGGMPALMHGVLKPIATFLAETPISTDTNAGATFGYYKFTRESGPKQQLIEAVKAASEAFPNNDELKNALKVVNSLPDISLSVFDEV
ncbi:679_t:CDS:10 [Dentiscutata erythropus]|uniref:679_t:CDS:1 n=1 Tax=Dentiscutata erythropus TaxID=1348616 RepID=A0A9N9FDX9_9GLOM|nr:679_t:CDS:10 [Dentiscutata erythropus]